MNILNNKKIINILPSLWGFLGFYRGVQHYDYNYNIELERYNIELERYNKKNNIYNKEDKKYLYKPNKYYLTSIVNGFNGLFLYIGPIPGIFYFIKEIYRLEIYLRNLDDEKNKEYYNTLNL